MKKALAYVRVSTEEQADTGLGLESQKQRVEAYCRMKGWPAAELYEDAGVSASKPLQARAAGGRLLKEAERGDVIIIAKLDRAFRSVADASTTIDELDKRGVAIVSLAEGFDTTDSNPFARAMLQMVAIFAELERNLIRQRTRDALGVKRSRGERISRHPPYGWDFAGDVLVLNQREQEVKALIVAEHAAGRSLRAIAALLNDRGIPAKRGRQWIHTSIRSILQKQP